MGLKLFYFLLPFLLIYNHTPLSPLDYEKIAITVTLYAYKENIIDKSKGNYIICFNENNIRISNTYSDTNNLIQIKSRNNEELKDISILIKRIDEVETNIYNVHFFSLLGGTEYLGYFTVQRDIENNFVVTNSWYMSAIE